MPPTPAVAVNPSASDRLLFGGAQIPLDGWRVFAVEGQHRERFLHSQLTSDVRGLEVGSSQLTALLDRSGRLQAFGYLCKKADRIELLMPGGAGEHMVAQLEAFVIADDVTIREIDAGQLDLALGAEALRLMNEIPRESSVPITGWGSRGFVSWSGADLDLPHLDPDEFVHRSLLSGLARWGVELRQGTPIHETTLIDAAVSFDKGCYLGQETVAKVASGRGAARAPMVLEVVSDDADFEGLVGQTIATGQKDRAGEIVACAVWHGRSYLTARLIRDLRVEGRRLECLTEAGQSIEVLVRSFPLLAAPVPEEWAHDLTVRAAAEFSADREGEAMRLFERAIAVCPGYADAYESLGVIHGRHGNYDEAIGLMTRLLEVEPTSVMAHTNLSLYYNQLGRIDDAEREAGEAMRAGMKREQIDRDRQRVEAEEAEAAAVDRGRRAELFRQVLDLDPDDALANFGLGELAVEEARFDDAIEHLKRALSNDPRYSAALLVLGRAHEGAGDIETARQIYRDGIEVSSAKGDLMTANKMQERLVGLDRSHSD